MEYQQRVGDDKKESNGALAIKNTVPEMKSALIGFTSRLNKVKERISKCEDKSLNIYSYL